jgi:hypothetical protein
MPLFIGARRTLLSRPRAAVPPGGGGGGSYEGLVATRLHLPQNSTTSNHWLMARSNHVATDTISSLKVAFANFYIQQNDMFEFGNGGIATVTASIEYPAGTFTQLLFTGSASGIIPAVSTSGATSEVGVLISDAATVSIPNGATFWVRHYFTNPNGIIHSTGQDTANGELLDFGATPAGGQDKTMGGTIVDAGSHGYSAQPVAIIANTTKAGVIAIGDSICYGFADATATATDWARGIICRGIPTTIPSLNLASYGSFAQSFLSVAPGRATLFPYCSHAVFEHGFNDLLNNTGHTPQTAAATIGYQQTLAAAFPARVRKLLTTITPFTTGSWSTLGGQTIGPNDAARVTYNGLVRANATAGFSDYLEMADTLESARDSGKWVVTPTPPYTGDGIHPNSGGNAIAAVYVSSAEATKFAYT